MLMKKIALAVLIGGMTVAGTAVAADKSSAMAAVAAAKAAQKAAGAVGGEWRDTGKMIKKAEQAIADGNYGEAEKMAKKAEAQGKLGKEQALSQKGVGNAGYLYN
ncbi:MAG: SoxXA-binding protein [Gammaproteobacteria bacterium]|nr:SoxXA-binding protein [Gammaproteobacteria bacterium]